MYHRTKEYMEFLETFVSDCKIRFFSNVETLKSVSNVVIELESIKKQIDNLYQKLENQKKSNSNPTGLIDNAEFIHIMKISNKTSQNWRQNNVIQYSIIGGKVFYRISDIIELFEKNVRNSTKL